MSKTLCGFLFLGALFVGCTCDFSCYLTKQSEKGLTDPNQIINNNICENPKKEFDEMREDIKKCSVTKINVDKLEAFVNDACSEKSAIQESFQKNKDCLVKNFGTAQECIPKDGYDLKPEDLNNPVEVFKSLCKKMDDIYKCFNNKLATACGEETGKLVQSFTDAYSSYTTGLCAEANGASVNQVLYMNILLGILFVLIMSHKN